MNKLFVFLVTVTFAGPVYADGESCFPISRSRDDYTCYSIDNKSQCLDRTDQFTCGWGQRNQDPPSDDDLLVCDDARCSNGKDGDEEDEI